MNFGAHVSISGGFDKCIDRILDLDGNSLMTFASSPRSLKFKEFPQPVIDVYLEKKSKAKIGPHFFHGVYLVNLATEDRSHLKASMDSLISYQQLSAAIQGVGTIFHIGSHKGRGLESTVNQIVSSINFILDSTPKDIKLILENAAGHKGTVGSTFEELSEIISRVGDRSKIGICLDTQHCFASGIPIESVLDRFDKLIGLKYLKVVHVNDSKTDFASHVDRHENLGDGKIGKKLLSIFLSDPRLRSIPLILEVPGIGEGPRKKDLDTLKSLVVK